MVRELRFALVVVALLSAQNLFAQVKLKAKLPPGSSATVESVLISNQTLVVNGMNVKTSSENRSTTRMDAGKLADGLLPVDITLEKLAINVVLGNGQGVQFDSANPAAAKSDIPQLEPTLAGVKALVGAKFIYQINADGKLENVEGINAVINNAPPSAADFLKEKLNLESMRENWSEERQIFPDKEISKGDSWDHTAKMKLDGAQTLTFERKYEYLGEESRSGRTFDKIKVSDTKVDYAIGPNPNNLTAKDSDLKIDSSEGLIEFDRERGLASSSKLVTQIKGTITLQVNGNDIPLSLDLTLERSSTLVK